MKLKALGKSNAKAIRNGSLLEVEDASQVSDKSWGNLAKMNDLEYITFDSQDATSGKNERAYVSGFMTTKKALEFIHTFNMNTDFLAIATIPGKYQRMTRIPVTIDNGKPYTNTPYILEKSGITHLKKEANVNLNEDVTMINCIDMQWERKANNKNGLFPAVVRELTKL